MTSGPSQAPGERWRVVRPPLLWHAWEDTEALVYHPASGDTHQVNRVTAAVLRRLEQESLAEPELARQVADELGADADDAWQDGIKHLLSYLRGLGLVESIP